MRSTLFCLAFFVCTEYFGQNTFYDLNTIQKIEISFSQSNWDYQMDTAKAGYEDYILADWVKVNGIQFDSVGVKYKGNSSYNATYAKNPIHIELDWRKNQSYQGIKDIKLGNGYGDPSMIREVLSYDILKNYMHCPKANFAQLYINGAYVGVYANAENISKTFCSDHFYSSGNAFIKCNPIINPGPNTKSNLKYFTTGDSTNYFNYYEVKSTYGWNDLRALCDSVTNHPSGMSSIIDVDRVIWMLAFNNVLVNLDSYTGVFAQNYYLYKDDNGRFNPIMWDLNMSLGGFPYVGSSNSSMGSLAVTNMQQLPATIHSTDPYWPLINAVMSNAMYKRMYIAHMKTIVNEIFASSLYQSKATQLQAVIDTAVNADPNKFFTYNQFLNGMTTNNTVGTYTVPGISNLMSARVSYLQGTADFTASAPSISSISATPANPAVSSAVSITALVTNALSNSVFLGYRFNQEDIFSKIQMYDDGLHNDGASGDNVFGATFTMSALNAQYYVYAENAGAGMFSPQRAEHEFYSLQASVQALAPGQLVINEFMAINQTDAEDETNTNEDWIELYNTTSTPINLYGLYLSDNPANHLKFGFPQNRVIQPYSYMVVWADEDSTTTNYVHCNFKLSGSGESILLSSLDGTLLDSITYTAQVADVSTGRCPDGTGAFSALPMSTFLSANCVTAIEEAKPAHTVRVFPNPATGLVLFETEENTSCRLDLYDVYGKLVLNTTLKQGLQVVSVSELAEGIYYYQILSGQRIVDQGKLSVTN